MVSFTSSSMAFTPLTIFPKIRYVLITFFRNHTAWAKGCIIINLRHSTLHGNQFLYCTNKFTCKQLEQKAARPPASFLLVALAVAEGLLAVFVAILEPIFAKTALLIRHLSGLLVEAAAIIAAAIFLAFLALVLAVLGAGGRIGAGRRRGRGGGSPVALRSLALQSGEKKGRADSKIFEQNDIPWYANQHSQQDTV